MAKRPTVLSTANFINRAPRWKDLYAAMMLDVGCESWPSNLPTLRLNLDCCRLGARYRQNGHDLDAFPGKNRKVRMSLE
jgi:hypothetical protein